MTLPDRPIRFLQVSTFYHRYLNDFYAAHPTLMEEPYVTQIDALLNDGFSGCHMFTRSLRALGFETMHVINDNPVSQATWLRENSVNLAGDIDLSQVTKLQIEAFKPDIVYFTDVVTFDSAFVSNLTQRPPVVAGWRGFPLSDDTDLSEYDVILTSFDRIFEEAKLRGAKDVVRFHPGFPDECTVPNEKRTNAWDVVFSGTVTQQHTRRIAILDIIAQLSQDAVRPFSFGLFMPDASALPAHAQVLNQGARWADDMLRTLRNAQIVINIDVDAFDNQPPNMRLIEATGAGAFLITPHHPELKNFFEPGLEVETFRNENELVSKLMYYLDNADACAEIGENARARCLKDHSLSARAPWFKDIMTESLDKKLTESDA